MRYLSTILLTLLTLLTLTAATFLVIDGNLARLTGWYRYKKGETLFQKSTRQSLADVDWMRIEDLHEQLSCERQPDGSWWITEPYLDRMAPEVAQAILAFTDKARLVDTLPLDRSTEGSLREFGVETSPYSVTLKRPFDNRRTTIARYTLGASAPWFADTGEEKTVVPTTYLRTDYYGNDQRIHVVTGNILSIFSKGLHGLRDPSPFHLKADDIFDVTIKEKGKDTLSLSRLSPQAPWVLSSPIITPANNEGVNELLENLLKIEALRIENSIDIDLSQQKKSNSITLKDSKGASYELQLYTPFFSEKDDALVSYATVSNRKVILVLPAAPRVMRKGSYATIINQVLSLPLLPPSYLKELRSGNTPVYCSELSLELDDLRSLQLSPIPEKDIARVSVNTPFARAPLRLLLIPGDSESKVPAQWMYSLASSYEEADAKRVKNFLQALNLVPLERILHDIKPTDDTHALLQQYGLDRPDYSITLLPLPCSYRSVLFGHDMPLIKDRPPVSYVIKYQRGKTIDDPATWIVHERGSSCIGVLSPTVAKYLSLDRYQWKDKRALNFPISALKTMTIYYSSATLALNFDYIGDRWTGTLNGKDVSMRINARRSLNYLRNLNKLEVVRWVPPTHQAALNILKNPIFKIRLDLELNNISQQEAFIIDDNKADAQQIESDLRSQGGVDSENYLDSKVDDEAITQSLFADEKKTKKSITLELAPLNPRNAKTPFYVRHVETGEIFVINHEDAWNLGNNLLEK